MINEFLNVFPDKEVCVNEIFEKHKFVYDHQVLKKGVFVNGDEIFHVHIENNTKENYHFVQNDECVMLSIKGGQCDFVLFNSGVIHFVEVKATNDNLSTHKKKIYKQLENTFKYYSEFLDKFDLRYALACFEAVNPRGYTKRKIPQSSKSEKKVLFKTKYSVDLSEGNYIVFE
ncbi:hypothetical protein [uncultured Chryseobacterium sp.]|uniref:hypothetical protein n=1 Tax=uncultured Chryseobacterium sp. TaxID=259322 RepID=UPI0025D38F1F|nr:hypothetical protein [uncultured Chryseobacterium sp.]